MPMNFCVDLRGGIHPSLVGAVKRRLHFRRGVRGLDQHLAYNRRAFLRMSRSSQRVTAGAANYGGAADCKKAPSG